MCGSSITSRPLSSAPRIAMSSHLPASVLSSVLSQLRSSHSASPRVTRTERSRLNTNTTSSSSSNTRRTLRPPNLSHKPGLDSFAVTAQGDQLERVLGRGWGSGG